jgi:hypothetical protein
MGNPAHVLIAAGVTFYKADVTSTASIAEAGKEIREAHGDPTVLVSHFGSRSFLLKRCHFPPSRHSPLAIGTVLSQGNASLVGCRSAFLERSFQGPLAPSRSSFFPFKLSRENILLMKVALSGSNCYSLLQSIYSSDDLFLV